ncbi:hypothetical protein DQG13_05535 [Paenibacillus sp. YN15]|nr:hypothetical protein DQG13_05535 [Paenibacillus sp. YN15]
MILRYSYTIFSSRRGEEGTIPDPEAKHGAFVSRCGGQTQKNGISAVSVIKLMLLLPFTR